MMDSVVFLSGSSEPAKKALISCSNSHLRRVSYAGHVTLILPVSSTGFTIGKDGDLRLDADDESCGWVAKVHATFKSCGQAVDMKNWSAAEFTVRRLPDGKPETMASKARCQLSSGTYRLDLGQNWFFHAEVWSKACRATVEVPETAYAKVRQRQALLNVSSSRARKLESEAQSQNDCDEEGEMQAENESTRDEEDEKEAKDRNSFDRTIKYSRRIYSAQDGRCEVLMGVTDDGVIVEKRCLKKEFAGTWAREAEVLRKLRQLRHENIIQFLHYEPGNSPTIWEPYIGPDLARIYDHKFMSNLSVESQGRAEQQLLSAVAGIRGLGLIHSDIKLSNIVHGKDPFGDEKFVLIDFGMAHGEDDTKLQCTWGTPYYLPPEAAFGFRTSTAGDVWAIGIVLLVLQGYLSIKLGDGWILVDDATSGFKEHWLWIKKIRAIKKKLPRNSTLLKMLDENPEARVKVLPQRALLAQ